MRTALSSSAAAGRTTLVAQLVPDGARAKLPADAPSESEWKSDFTDSAGRTVMLRGSGGKRWLLIRVPKAKQATAEDVREAAGTARLAAEDLERGELAIDLSLLPKDADHVQAAAEGAGMAGYDPGVKKKDRKKANVTKVVLVGAGSSAGARAAAQRGQIAAEANLAAREVQNLPSNLLTPKDFAAQARKVAGKSPQVTVRVFGEKKMAEMKMGSLLSVSQGSHKEAQLVHFTYKPKGKAKGKVAVVGKGLIFDSGGISLKPSANMDHMKFDMCGAGAVLGLFHGLASGAECPYEVHGVMGCVENMPGGGAQNPGDIQTAMNGTTIEVLNTDAEGRLVLADCLTYAARKIKPDWMVDLATLTGAVIHCLGHLATGILGNDDKLRDKVQAVGEKVGERCWPLPMWEDYRELMKGKYADLQNIYAAGQGAGTIAGGSFLSYFVDEVPWVHLDIAGTAWEGPKKSYASEGGRGVGVRLLLELLRT